MRVMCDFYICLHACVYKYYFPQFIFVFPFCAFLLWHLTSECFFLYVGCFIIVILDLEIMRERENNLAMLRKTFSLLNFGKWCNVWKCVQNETNMLFQNILLKYQSPLTWFNIVLGRSGQFVIEAVTEVNISQLNTNALISFTKNTISLNIVNILTHSYRTISVFNKAALPFIIMTIVYKPYQRGVYCDDESIKYPIKPDTITHGMLAAVTISCTVVIVSFTQNISLPFLLKGNFIPSFHSKVRLLESVQGSTHLKTSCKVCSITKWPLRIGQMIHV